MKRNMKIMISALSVMLLMAIAVTVLTFSFANNQDADGELTDEGQLVFAGMSDDYTNIDNIIENSYAIGTDANPIYRIVEIGSSQTPSTMEQFVKSKGFEQFVINAHGTIGKDINADSIEYKYYPASSITDDSTEDLAYISNADFIYVSNDAASEYSKSNDICEELYNILHTFAVGSYKPLVIDSPNATTVAPGGSEENETMTTLANDVFAPTGKYYYTFEWDKSKVPDAQSFLAHAPGSMYLGINGGKAESKGKWTTIYDNKDPVAEGVNKFNVSKFLIVSSDGTTRTMTDELLAGSTNVDLSATHYYVDGSPVADTNIYDIKDTAMKQYGYNNRYSVPDYVAVSEVSLAALEADLALATPTIDFDQYDMIIIESNCGGKTITFDLYKKFAAAMYGSISIVYDSSMSTASSSGGGSTDVPDDLQETNYTELYYMVATLDNVSRYQNVMVTDKRKFDIITSSNSADTCKVIADLINASSFRGIGGQGSSSNMFSVLEIQPCYPIDEAVAQEVGKKITRNDTYSVYGSGNYYTVPSEVVDGKTKEELEDGTQYYAWELSKAKIADITGLSVNQINLVQMSSEELASSKTEILGTYDLIYVGGNTSALRDANEYRSLIGLAGWAGVLKSQNINTPEQLRQLPIYTMYSHSGDLATTIVATYGGVVQGRVAASQAVVNGQKKDNSFAVLNGNDITYNKLQELTAYVQSGMPVVLSKEISAAYDIAKANGYLQNSLDPDSNMYKFLDACKAVSDDPDNTKANVLWQFDQSKVVRADNNGGQLGNTATGYVYVFAGGDRTVDIIDNTVVDGDKTAFVDLLAKANRRPKLTVTSMPKAYNQYDASTKLDGGTLSFNYRITGTSKNYAVRLYIDDDGNSVFDTSEEVASGDSTKLTYQVADSFFGPLYWKLEVTDAAGLTTSTTGLSYIKNKTNEKQTVRVLQIMPYSSLVQTNDPARDPNTLFFCPICQQTYHRLDYNPTSDAGDRDSYSALYSGRYTDTNDGSARANKNIYMGRHEHEFGIVKYDSNMVLPAGTPTNITSASTTGMDNWDENLADEISDLYDFDLDIMNRAELEQTSNEVRKAYDFSNMSDADKQELINEFAIDEEDADYEKYNAMTEIDDKVAFIKQREYEQLAGKYWQLYQYMSTQSAESGGDSITDEAGNVITATTIDEEKKMVAMIEKMIANAATPSGAPTFSCSPDKLRSELQRLIDEKCYWDYYSINNFAAQSNDVSIAYLGESFDPYYAAYVKAKDKELEYADLYKKYDRLAHPDNWLLGCYDTVIIGPSEDFAGDDITDPYALADIKDFIDNDGTLLLFHDTLTKFADSGSVTLTTTLKESFGMDRYHMELDETAIADKTITDKVVYGGNLSVSLNGMLNFTIQPNTETVTLDIQKGQYYGYTGTPVTSGTLSGAGDITFDITVTNYDGSILANHDVELKFTNYDFSKTVTGTTDAEGKLTLTLPNYSEKTTTYTAADYYYLPYVTTKDAGKFFMTNLSTKSDDSKYASWLTDMKNVLGATPGKYLTNVAYTDVVATSDKSNNSLSLPYRYADVDWDIFVNWNQDAQGTAKTFTKFGTNKASQNNKGIITMFPFTLSDELNISGTHSQAYALDIEDEDMTVWYSLAAGANDKGGSSVFAASPRDGMDNYFIYTYKNVNYCGAGHSKVTGIGKDNNDERRLYINIICNSVRNSVRQPAIYVYDYEKDTYGDKIKRDNYGEYFTKVDEMDEYPEFSFKVEVDDEATLERVRIYYDLDFSDTNKMNDYVEDKYHKLIADWSSYSVKEGIIKDVFRYDSSLKVLYDAAGNQIAETYVDENNQEVTVAATMLKLQPQYFEPYNNEYTYIVIEATDSKGNKVYQRIKIMLKDVLFNLT